jgi:hypothetical protein
LSLSSLSSSFSSSYHHYHHLIIIIIIVIEFNFIISILSIEHQEEGYNALIGMLRAGSTAGREETWERVLLAERFI